MFKSLRVHRNYRLFFTGQLVSVIGTWMQNIALAWLVIELTSSPDKIDSFVDLVRPFGIIADYVRYLEAGHQPLGWD